MSTEVAKLKAGIILSLGQSVGVAILSFAQIDDGLQRLLNLMSQIAEPGFSVNGTPLRIDIALEVNIKTISDALPLIAALAPYRTELEIMLANVGILKAHRHFLAHGALDTSVIQDGVIRFYKSSHRKKHGPRVDQWETNAKLLRRLARDISAEAAFLLSLLSTIMTDLEIDAVSSLIERPA